jgi:hypothetical protein
LNSWATGGFSRNPQLREVTTICMAGALGKSDSAEWVPCTARAPESEVCVWSLTADEPALSAHTLLQATLSPRDQ